MLDEILDEVVRQVLDGKGIWEVIGQAKEVWNICRYRY